MDRENACYTGKSQKQSHLRAGTIHHWDQPGGDNNSTLMKAGGRKTGFFFSFLKQTLDLEYFSAHCASAILIIYRLTKSLYVSSNV